MLEHIEVRRLSLPLRVPYKLAFGDVVAFDTIIAQVSLNGRIGCGEATILSGYTTETIEQAWHIAKQLVGVLAQRALQRCEVAAADRARSPIYGCHVQDGN